METILILLFVIGVLYFVVILVNSVNIRDPKKLDVINFKKLDEITLSKFPFISILVKNYYRETYGRSTNKVTEKMIIYSVVLLSKNHRNRIKIGGFDTREEAKQFLLEISDKYSKQPVKYAPQVSEKTRNRR